VIGYGLSERLVPGLLHFASSVSAQGRLEQPLTYWNAMGEVAALGFVLCCALAGDASRSRALRAAAGAAAAPLGMGLYISFSRGALFACAAGLVALVVLVRRREQLRAVIACVAGGVVAALAAAPFKEVTALSGGSRELEGAVVLALLIAIAAATGMAVVALSRAESAELKLPRRAPAIALAVICAGLALAIVVGAKENSRAPLSGGAARLATLQSNRYAYWRVALRAFGDEPLRGVGAGGWSVYWLRDRKINEFAQDAHSLELQTLAELGLIGFAFLLAFVGGVAWAARDALRVAPVLAGGPVAGLVVWLAHSPLDWDWEMPAVTLIALVLAGAVLGLAELVRPPGRLPK
jgi:O-antigen ligase